MWQEVAFCWQNIMPCMRGICGLCEERRISTRYFHLGDQVRHSSSSTCCSVSIRRMLLIVVNNLKKGDRIMDNINFEDSSKPKTGGTGNILLQAAIYGGVALLTWFFKQRSKKDEPEGEAK